MSELKNFFKKTPPFSALPENEISRLEKVGKLTRFSKGETIFSEGEEAKNVWVLISGRLDIYKYNSDGRPFALENIDPGDLFGSLCRVAEELSTYPCAAVAATESQAVSIPDSVFFDQYDKFPSFIKGVCGLCSTRLNSMRDVSCKTQEPVEVRIARTLIDLSKKHGKTIPLTKREIAELSATTVETAIRTMSRFQKKGWISSERGKVSLEDPAKIALLLE